VIDFVNETDNKEVEKILPELLQISDFLTQKECELIFVDNKKIKELNKKYKNTDKETDVLSFPTSGSFLPILGTIVISLEYAKTAAKKYGHKIEDEIKLLFIHGLLHLLGYDHETDNGIMRKKEEELIKKFNLPSSLIVRTTLSQQ
jgi:probable rRNA maturation factor